MRRRRAWLASYGRAVHCIKGQIQSLVSRDITY